MKLYFAPRTRAVRARWLLEELEVPYEGVKLDLSNPLHLPAELRDLNPLGEVPVLIDGEVRLTVSSAACLYLADRFPQKGLAPPLGSAERADYLEWLLFAELTLEPLVREELRIAALPAEQRPAAGPGSNRERVGVALGLLKARLEGREFLVGGSFSAADILVTSVLHMAHHAKLLDGFPTLFDYVKRTAGRPASRRAVA